MAASRPPLGFPFELIPVHLYPMLDFVYSQRFHRMKRGGAAMSKRKYSYEYPRPAVTVDMALFTVSGTLQRLRLEVLLIQRDGEPFRGSWALPGGFVHDN